MDDATLWRSGPAKPSHEMAERGLRVLAVARDAQVLGVVGLKDPPRPDVAGAIEACRRAHINLAVITGDHLGTARAVALEVGLSTPDSAVLTGPELPEDDAALVDRDGVVVARVSPEQKLRLARVRAVTASSSPSWYAATGRSSATTCPSS